MRKPDANSNALTSAFTMSPRDWSSSPYPKNEERLAGQLSWPNPASRQITHERAVRCTRLDLSVTNAFVTNAFCHALLSMLRSGNFWDHATPETDHQLRPVRAVHQSVRRFRPQPDLFRVEGLCDSGCLPRRHLRRRSPGGRPGPPYSRGLEQTPHVLLVQPDPGYPPQPGRAG